MDGGLLFEAGTLKFGLKNKNQQALYQPGTEKCKCKGVSQDRAKHFLGADGSPHD